jgi:hypothetical protein
MNGRVVQIARISNGDQLRWSDLAAHALEPNPMFEPECLIPAARLLPNGDEILLAVAEEGDRFFACVPLTSAIGVDATVAKVPGLRRRAITTQVRRLRYDGTPLVRDERGLEALTALLRMLSERARHDGGILVLDTMREDGPVAELLNVAVRETHFLVRTYSTWQRPIVRRRDDLSYRDQHSRETLRTTAKHLRRLERDLGAVARLVNLSDDAGAVDRLMTIEAAGYKGAMGVDLLSHPGEPEWLRDMCTRFRDENRLGVYALQVGDATIAMQLVIRGGSGLFGLYIVYDETFAKYSPGIQLLLDVIDVFHTTTDAAWLDSCAAAGNKTFLWIYPDRVTVSTRLVALGGWVDRVYVRGYILALALAGAESDLRRRHRRLDALITRSTAALTSRGAGMTRGTRAETRSRD